jgi:hypothetical protein
MKKHTLLFAAAALGGMSPAFAQQDNFLLFSSQHQLSSAAVMPSQFGTGYEQFWISLPSVHAWGGTDFLRRGEAVEILNGGQVPTELVNGMVNRLDRRNHIYAGAEISPFAAGYTVRKNGVEIISLHLSWTEQAAAQAVVGEYFGKVAWYGNQPYAGTPLQLGPLEGSAIYQRRIALGAALPLLNNEKLSLRSGFRLHYNMGMAGAYVRPSQAELFTAQDGSFIDYDLLVRAQLSGLDNFDPMRTQGRGAGVDFSTSLAWDASGGGRFTADAGIADLGYMRFNGDVRTERIKGEQVFSGFEVTDVVNPFDGLTTDTLRYFFSTESEPGGSFAMPMSTRITLRFGYHIRDIDQRGQLFNRHSFYGVFGQGLVNGPVASTVPGLTAAYVYNMNNVLELGTSMGYVNDGLDLGAFFSVRGGPFRFGMGSTDFSGLFINNSHASADASMRMSLAF